MAWSLVVGGCLIPDRGTAIANDIRDAGHPLIERVDYGGDDDDSGPMIEIWLQPEATREQARAIVCDVINPAVDRGSPPENLVFEVYGLAGETLADERTQCGAAHGTAGEGY